MSVKRPVSAYIRRSITSAEVPALGLADLQVISDILVENAPGWSAELYGICANEASLVVVPEGGEDLLGPSFIISREAAGYRVSQIHWDVTTHVGHFLLFAEAVGAVRQRLAACNSFSMMPISATRH